jgi:hypothetical protein
MAELSAAAGVLPRRRCTSSSALTDALKGSGKRRWWPICTGARMARGKT